MSAKKIIAICQSGGEFQTEKDGSMSYIGGEAYAVDLDLETQVIDFKQDLADTFGYSVDNMLIKYFLPRNKKTLIMISKDKDLKRMINFYADSDQVDVFLMPHEGVKAAPDISNMPANILLSLSCTHASRSSRTTGSEAVILPSSPVTTTENQPNTTPEINSPDLPLQTATEDQPNTTPEINSPDLPLQTATEDQPNTTPEINSPDLPLQTATEDQPNTTPEINSPDLPLQTATEDQPNTTPEIKFPDLPLQTATEDQPNTTPEINSADLPLQMAISPSPVPLNSNREKQQKAATQWENTITGVEQRFSSFAEFREALHKFSIAHGFRYKYKNSDCHRVSVKCKSENCPWRIYVSRLPTTHLIRIKKMNPEHTCTGATAKAGYRATKGWVGNIIKEKLKSSPNYRPKDIVEDIKREYGVQFNYSQAWRAKGIAKEQLQGSYKESFSQLPAFCEKIMETNPGSLATFVTKEDSSFHRFFVSFHASILGFQQSCRPLLFLDDIPLDAKYQGTLLIASGADGDDGVFPLAFAVVDDENDDDNWFWFLTQLKSCVNVSQPITFVANFNEGVKESIVKVFGTECFHAYCLRYVSEKLNNDLKTRFSHEARRSIVQHLYDAAYAPKMEGFQRCVEDIKAISPEAYDWVIKSEPEHWANVFFDGTRYNHMTSNFGQLFYDWVSEAVELPITNMIDLLRSKLMELIYTRRVDSNKWTTTLTPSMEEKLKVESSKAQGLQVLPSESSVFEVHGENVVEVVDISQWDCSCKGWQLTGLPCCHAVAVFECIGRSVYDYCSRYFLAESYKKTYAESIYPIPDVEGQLDGDDVAVLVTPPPAKRPPGKPGRRAKLKQAASLELIRRQMQCSKCKGFGHNKKTCKEEEVVEASTNEDLSIEMG